MRLAFHKKDRGQDFVLGTFIIFSTMKASQFVVSFTMADYSLLMSEELLRDVRIVLPFSGISAALKIFKGLL